MNNTRNCRERGTRARAASGACRRWCVSMACAAATVLWLARTVPTRRAARLSCATPQPARRAAPPAPRRAATAALLCRADWASTVWAACVWHSSRVTRARRVVSARAWRLLCAAPPPTRACAPSRPQPSGSASAAPTQTAPTTARASATGGPARAAALSQRRQAPAPWCSTTSLQPAQTTTSVPLASTSTNKQDALVHQEQRLLA